MKFFIKNFFRKCDQIRRKLRIWSHLLKKLLMENFIFCAVIFLSETFQFIIAEICRIHKNPHLLQCNSALHFCYGVVSCYDVGTLDLKLHNSPVAQS